MQLSKVDSSCRGPTETSHWVIPELLLSSAYPGSKDNDEHRRITRAIYHSGIQLFLNLMEPKELNRFTPYKSQIEEYAYQDGRKIEFLSFPIPDQNICQDDQKVLELCLNLTRRLKEDHQKIVIHCWGGHGRTGTIISIIIAILFQLGADDALNWNYQLKRQRLRIKGRTRRLGPRQSQQVRTVLQIYKEQQTSSIVSSVEQQLLEQ